MRFRRVTLSLFLVLACSDEDAGVDSTPATISAETVPALAVPPRYTVGDSGVAGWGSISVSVAVSDAPPDTAVLPMNDQDACGVHITDNSMSVSRGQLAGAVTWLSGVHTGKDFPVRRRYEIVHSGCLLTPRVQGVARGGTLNVRNLDDATHILRFTDVESGKLLTTVRQTDRGQVIPIESVLDSARRIEVTCETHPWTKAWILVFDHPYFATTDALGLAAMDSVPAGARMLHVWHERLEDVARETAVAGGARTNVTVQMRGRQRQR